MVYVIFSQGCLHAMNRGVNLYILGQIRASMRIEDGISDHGEVAHEVAVQDRILKGPYG